MAKKSKRVPAFHRAELMERGAVEWSGDFLSDVAAMVSYLEGNPIPPHHRSQVNRALTGLRGVLQRQYVEERRQMRAEAKQR